MSDEREPHATPAIRKGQGDVQPPREEFEQRLRERFYDPAFDSIRAEIDRYERPDASLRSPRPR